MKSENKLSKIIILIIAILPLLWFNRVEHVSVKMFIFGSGSWGIGCLIKIFMHQLLVVPLQKKQDGYMLPSLLNGLFSGICELGAAAGIILLVQHKTVFDLDAVISFGLGIGAFEALVVVFSKGNDLFKGTALEQSSDHLVAFLEELHGYRHVVFNIMLPVLERVLATLLHVSTRGLVFITILTGKALPAILALLVFTIADGMLAYYYHISGRLATVRGYVEIHIYLFMLALTGLVLFMSQW